MLMNECDLINCLDEELIIQKYLSSNNDVINVPAMDQDSYFSTSTIHPCSNPLNFGNQEIPCEILVPPQVIN